MFMEILIVAIAVLVAAIINTSVKLTSIPL